MRTRRFTTITAAFIALALTGTACDDGSDIVDSAPFDDDTVREPIDTDQQPIETAETADGDSAGDDGDDRDAGEDGDDESTGDELSDDEVLDLIEDMSDDEFDEFVAGLSDDEYERLVAIVEGVDTDAADDTVDGGGEDAAATETTGSRNDVDCTAEGLGSDDAVAFTSAHPVVDGRLGEVCFGDVDQRLIDAWQSLATIAPQGQLADLGLFGGFDAVGDGDDVTLAFVNTLDDDGTLFQMSVNLVESDADPAELQLTMAHEFTHVFTALPSQVERTVEAIDACDTYYNGEGCYYDDSIMFQWIEEFWGDGLIDQIDPEAEATADDGQARCDADPGFFGAYAASTPEEDFAEAFSAFVFGIETFSDEQQERIDWIAARPGLAEYRDRAIEAGVPTPPNNFDECGLG